MPVTSAAEQCANCKFWRTSDPNTTTVWGKCMAHPPTLSSISTGKTLPTEHHTSQFPMTHSTAWCGEYKKGGVL